jgi:hypothetical protein
MIVAIALAALLDFSANWLAAHDLAPIGFSLLAP